MNDFSWPTKVALRNLLQSLVFLGAPRVIILQAGFVHLLGNVPEKHSCLTACTLSYN